MLSFYDPTMSKDSSVRDTSCTPYRHSAMMRYSFSIRVWPASSSSRADRGWKPQA